MRIYLCWLDWDEVAGIITRNHGPSNRRGGERRNSRHYVYRYPSQASVVQPSQASEHSPPIRRIGQHGASELAISSRILPVGIPHPRTRQAPTRPLRARMRLELAADQFVSRCGLTPGTRRCTPPPLLCASSMSSSPASPYDANGRLMSIF